MKLYTHRNLPKMWIAEDPSGILYVFPAVVDGWTKRALYTGDSDRLQECGRHNSVSTGWPGIRALNQTNN